MCALVGHVHPIGSSMEWQWQKDAADTYHAPMKAVALSDDAAGVSTLNCCVSKAELAVVYPQVGFAFRSVENALTLIVRNLESFSGLAAETERLDALAAGAFCIIAVYCLMSLVWVDACSHV